MALFSGTLSQTLWTLQILAGHVERRNTVAGYNSELATAIGRIKLTVLATVDIQSVRSPPCVPREPRNVLSVETQASNETY